MIWTILLLVVLYLLSGFACLVIGSAMAGKLDPASDVDKDGALFVVTLWPLALFAAFCVNIRPTLIRAANKIVDWLKKDASK